MTTPTQSQTAKELGPKKFFESPSKLSKGQHQRRFDGVRFHQTHLQHVTHK